MSLTGIQIYKLLPQTNCKDCEFPTCLAFAMKLAAKQIELSACPHVSEESKAQLSSAAEPPVRLVTISANGHQAKAGNEVVLFRHEKTFYNKPGIFILIRDDTPPGEIAEKAKAIGAYMLNYVGIELRVDGIAVRAENGSAETFAAAVQAVRSSSSLPVILISDDPDVIAAGLAPLDGEHPLICGANPENWEAMGDLALQRQASLSVTAGSLSEIAELTEKLKEKGVLDLALYPQTSDLAGALVNYTHIRRLALKKNFRPLGFPILSTPYQTADAPMESLLAAQSIAKYGGFIIIENFQPERVYPLLVLRENIYTDPQKPIQVQPGLYEINDPKPEDPLLVTTNFSITYFSVANEVESSGQSAWLLVADAEGMSVLTAWAAGNFDAERIAKDVKRFEAASKLNHKRIVIPGHVAVISGELEEELPDWEVRVGPREAVDLTNFLKEAL